MKIYFSAAITKNQKLKNLYTKLVNFLKKNGHTVLEYGSDRLTPQELIGRSDDEIARVYTKLDSFLKQADMYIAEISDQSIGVGYEISQAIASKKPVLALVHKDYRSKPLATIQGNKSKLLMYKEYDENTLETIVNDFVESSKTQLDVKFIMILPAEIDRYLEWASREYKLHKSQIMRISVEERMAQDVRWKNYQK